MATRSTNTDERCGLPAAVVEDLLEPDTRRQALRILADRGEPVVVKELATAVVASRLGCSIADVPTDARDLECQSLYTDHLPKLTATGVVTYDSMLGTVTLDRPEIVDTSSD